MRPVKRMRCALSARLVAGAMLVALWTGTAGHAEVKTYRVGDAQHPWRLSPVSGLLNWGQSWSVEVLLDDDGDGRIDEDPVELIDDDNDGLYNEDPPEVQVDNDGDGRLSEDPVNGVDDDGDGSIDEDSPESFDNDLDGQLDEDGPDEQVDNDGDGRLGEDHLWTYGDDDYDGRWNEDWPNGVDDDGDGLVDEDRYGHMTDFDDDCVVDADNQFDLAKCDGGRPSTANEDPADGVDNDGDGLVDEDGRASERAGITSWLSPIRLHDRRDLVPLLASRQKRAEFGVGTVVAPTQGDLRREIPIAFNSVSQGDIGRALFSDYGRAFDGNLFTAYASKEGGGGIAVRPFGFFYITRFLLRPRPTFADDAPHTYTVYYGTRDQVDRGSQRASSILVPSVVGDRVNEIKDFSFDPPILMGGIWFQISHVAGDRWEIGEIGVLGDGYPADGYYSSEVIDVGTDPSRVRRYQQPWDLYKNASEVQDQFDEDVPGRLVTWGRVRWRGQRTGNATGDVRIQFRAGNTPDTHKYLRQLGPGVFDDRSEAGGPLDAFTWSLDPVRRAGIEFLPYNELGKDIGVADMLSLNTPGEADDGLRGWSFWSAPLKFEDGSIDHNPEGVLLSLPAQTRYIQCQISFDSDQQGGVVFDYLEFDYDVPLVGSGLVAEVFPDVAPLGAPVQFRYFIQPRFQGQGAEGFNRIDIAVPSPATRVTGLKVDTVPWEEIAGGGDAQDALQTAEPRLLGGGGGQYAQAIQTDTVAGVHRLQLKLPTLTPSSVPGFRPGLGGAIEVQFTSTLFRGAMELASSVWNDANVASGASFIAQPAEPGDATAELFTNGFTVVATQIDRLVSETQVDPNPFSPNGDGFNDSVSLTFDLYLVTQAVFLRVEIYDLSGHRVRTLEPSGRAAGRVRLQWDGKNDAGQLAAPGLYLYRLTAADVGNVEDRAGAIVLVY